MSFKVGDTTFGFTMRVPECDEASVDDLFHPMPNGRLKLTL